MFPWIPGKQKIVQVCQYVQRNSIIPPSKAATSVVKGAFEGDELEDGGEPDVCGGGVVCFLIDLSEAGGRGWCKETWLSRLLKQLRMWGRDHSKAMD